LHYHNHYFTSWCNTVLKLTVDMLTCRKWWPCIEAKCKCFCSSWWHCFNSTW